MPLCKAACYSLRFCAASSQVSGFRLKDLRDPFNVSWYRFLGPLSSPNSSFLGSQLSGIRATMSCPSELRFFQEGVDARESSTGQGLCIREYVLPFYPE